MKKDVQKEFIKGLTNLLSGCIEIIKKRYDLGKKSPDAPSTEIEKEYYNDRLLFDIKKSFEEFNHKVITYSDGGLIKEIERNLLKCTTMHDKERYIFSLLKPFKEYCDLIYPELSINKRKREEIKRCVDDIKKWEDIDEQKEAKIQIKACNEDIEDLKDEIERNILLSRHFFNIAYLLPASDEYIERIFSSLGGVLAVFTNKLDALLLTHGIDLMALQEDCAIYLKHERIITDVDCYIGSIELAQKYIDALPKKAQNVLSEKTENPIVQYKGLSKKLNKNECKILRKELIKIGYISDIPENYFLYWFGGTDEVPENVCRIVWKVKNKKNGFGSKKSLLDFLVLLGYKENEIRRKINDVFKVENSRKFVPQDYTKYRDWSEIKSEYHSEMSTLLTRIKI